MYRGERAALLYRPKLCINDIGPYELLVAVLVVLVALSGRMEQYTVLYYTIL